MKDVLTLKKFWYLIVGAVIALIGVASYIYIIKNKTKSFLLSDDDIDDDFGLDESELESIEE